MKLVICKYVSALPPGCFAHTPALCYLAVLRIRLRSYCSCRYKSRSRRYRGRSPFRFCDSHEFFSMPAGQPEQLRLSGRYPLHSFFYCSSAFQAGRNRTSRCRPGQASPSASPARRTTSAAAHATAHCQITTVPAHFPPSSRRIDATAATQGV